MPCESAALSPSCSGTWMHVAQARRREAGARWGWCAVGLVGVLGDATLREAPGRHCRGQPPNPCPSGRSSAPEPRGPPCASY